MEILRTRPGRRKLIYLAMVKGFLKRGLPRLASLPSYRFYHVRKMARRLWRYRRDRFRRHGRVHGLRDGCRQSFILLPQRIEEVVNTVSHRRFRAGNPLRNVGGAVAKNYLW